MYRPMAIVPLLVVTLLLGGTTPATAGCKDVLTLATPAPKLAATVSFKGFITDTKKVSFSGKLTPGVLGNLTASAGIPVAFPNVTTLQCTINNSLITTGKPATDLKNLNTALKTTKIGGLDYIMSLTDASGSYVKGTFNNTKKDYTKMAYTVSGLQFALFSGSAKLGFAPVAIKVGSKKTLGLYANITAGSVTIQLDYFRKFMANGTNANTVTKNVVIPTTDLSVKKITGCSLQLRKKVPKDATAPPDFYLDCAKIKITLNRYTQIITPTGTQKTTTDIVLAGTGFTAQAPVSAITVVP